MAENTEIIERINFYVRQKGGNKSALARDWGVSPSHLGVVMKGTRQVSSTMLKNANISSAGVLPMCQDTGTAIIMGYKGENVFTNCDDSKQISLGVYNTYKENNLRFSQLAPLSMFEEKNTSNNLPAEITLFATQGMEYKFAFVQKGGG